MSAERKEVIASVTAIKSISTVTRKSATDMEAAVIAVNASEV